MYCAETNQVLDKRTLGDKEGERLAVIEIIKGMGYSVPKGILSGNAGIVSPAVTLEIIEAGHGYVLQIKGKAGAAFQEVSDLPWERVIVANEEWSTGHGRKEFRRVKALVNEFADFSELDKYTNIGVVLQVERMSRYMQAGEVTKFTDETSYYIGDETFASLGIEMQARYIRDHWAQESYHWIKDKVMQEDDSMQRFIDRFNADPKNIALAL